MGLYPRQFTLAFDRSCSHCSNRFGLEYAAICAAVMQTGSPAFAALSGSRVSFEKLGYGNMLSAVQSGFIRSTLAAASAASCFGTFSPSRHSGQHLACHYAGYRFGTRGHRSDVEATEARNNIAMLPDFVGYVVSGPFRLKRRQATMFPAICPVLVSEPKSLGRALHP